MKKVYKQPLVRVADSRTEYSFCTSGLGGTAPDFQEDDYAW